MKEAFPNTANVAQSNQFYKKHTEMPGNVVIDVLQDE
jgi:hypothetical protein